MKKCIDNIRIAVLLPLLAMLLISCVLPKAVENDQSKCQLVTKKLTLEKIDGYNGECFSKNECLGAAIIGGVSSVVSGSIVVIGNTVHWLEKQGRCNDTELENEPKDSIESKSVGS